MDISLLKNRVDEAKRRLDAGLPIHYYDKRYPDAVVKEFPDGRKHLVTFDDDSSEVFLCDFPDE